MRVSTSNRFNLRTLGTGMMALVALGWAIFLPGSLFWTSALAAGLIGSAAATAILVRNRSIPSLAQVIANAEAELALVTAGREH